MREWSYSFIILDLGNKWELHAPAALAPGKEPPVPFGEEAD
jgi:hypothetical protein